tara:strand:- start:5226 stop:6035 length:810 start_codon:yes stop_codon:yes gene_type:complete
MSALLNKRILFVNDGESFFTTLKEELESRSFKVFEAGCNDLDVEYLKTNSIDLVILDHSHDGSVCDQILELSKSVELNKTLPVLSLVHDSVSQIEETLDAGAADYVTAEEKPDSIIRKIEAVLSEDSVFGDDIAIDITESEAVSGTAEVRVFVVEDDPLLRNLLSIRLQKSSFPHEFSTESGEIVPAIQQFKPDVIILDLMLPGKSGFEILEEVKQIDELKDVPVVVFSNKDGEENRNRAMELGANDFFVKAMTDLSELMEKIQTLVSK